MVAYYLEILRPVGSGASQGKPSDYPCAQIKASLEVQPGSNCGYDAEIEKNDDFSEKTWQGNHMQPLIESMPQTVYGIKATGEKTDRRP